MVSAARTDDTSKHISALTGLPGRVTMGVPATQPVPCGMPGGIADLDELDPLITGSAESWLTTWRRRVRPPLVTIRSIAGISSSTA